MTSTVVFLWIGLTQQLGAGTDDVFITLYAGQSLADGRGIVNYNGERVEMSSSLFHTLVVAAIDVVAPGYVFTLNKLVGGIVGALTLGLVYLGRGLLFQVGRMRFAAYAVTMFLLATNPAFAHWSFGGLETPFAAFFLLAYGIAVLSHRFRQSRSSEAFIILAQCCFILVRPEGFYLVLFTTVYLLLLKAVARRPIRWRLLAAPLVFLAVLTAFRWQYFGDFLPNTVAAKSGGLYEGLANGGVYLAHFFTSSALLLVVFCMMVCLTALYAFQLVGVARSVPHPTPAPLAQILLFGLGVTALLVVLFSGGDWMAHFRFCVPAIPILYVVLVTSGFNVYRAFAARLDQRQTLNVVTALAIAFAAYSNVNQSSVNTPRMLPFRNGDPGLDYSLLEVLRSPEPLDETVIRLNGPNRAVLRSLDRFLDNVFPGVYETHRPIVIATGQLGLFPYRIRSRYPDGEIRFIDTLGLADQTVAHLPMPKDPIGLKDGRFVDQVLAGESGPLSEYVIAEHPNMAYMLGGAALDLTANIQRLDDLGYELIWDRAGQLIFLKRDG